MVGFLQRNTNVKENLKLLKHEKKDYFTVFTQPVFVNLILITFYLYSSFFLGVSAFFENLCVDFVLLELSFSSVVLEHLVCALDLLSCDSATDDDQESSSAQGGMLDRPEATGQTEQTEAEAAPSAPVRTEGVSPGEACCETHR